jgi:hypothetical protein
VVQNLWATIFTVDFTTYLYDNFLQKICIYVAGMCHEHLHVYLYKDVPFAVDLCNTVKGVLYGQNIVTLLPPQNLV